MSNENCNYTFTHIKTGKKVISQTWAEFYKLQSNSNEYRQEYRRLGTTEFPRVNNISDIYHLEERINKFFNGAKGYEQVGKLNTISVSYNPFRVFLKFIHNHACMVGDKQTVESTEQMDKWFWSNSNHSRLLLTQ